MESGGLILIGKVRPLAEANHNVGKVFLAVIKYYVSIVVHIHCQRDSLVHMVIES